jgi:hypothetical protein
LYFHQGHFYDHIQNIIFVYVIFDSLMEHGLATHWTQVKEWRDLIKFGSQAHDFFFKQIRKGLQGRIFPTSDPNRRRSERS